MLGNLEDIKDYHKKIFLPKMEEAIDDASLMRSVIGCDLKDLFNKIETFQKHFRVRATKANKEVWSLLYQPQQIFVDN